MKAIPKGMAFVFPLNPSRAYGCLPSNAAVRLTAMLLDSDVVEFAVGTRINEAHQDPNIPVEFDLRRNIVNRIARALETKYRKRVIVHYL
jgi:hypothetical protein